MLKTFQPKRPISRKRQGSSKGVPTAKAREEIVFGIGESSLGHVLVASSKSGVVAILIGQDPDYLVEDLEKRFPEARLVHEDRDCAELVARVVECIEKPTRRLDVPLDLRGTAFQIRVWNAVREVPAGQTSTYSEIANQIGKPKAIRAVGNACSNSIMAMAVPCHRVLHKDGSLSRGSFWGNDGQRVLLDREAAATSKKRKKVSR